VFAQERATYPHVSSALAVKVDVKIHVLPTRGVMLHSCDRSRSLRGVDHAPAMLVFIGLDGFW
jgi:hypothetical protein